MGDTFQDPFDDDDSRSEDGGRPRTPEIHFSGERKTTEEDKYSDISDSGEDEVNQDKPVEAFEKNFEAENLNEGENSSDKSSFEGSVGEEDTGLFHSPVSSASVCEENESKRSASPSSENLIDKTSDNASKEAESFLNEELDKGDRSLTGDGDENLENNDSVELSNDKTESLGGDTFEAKEDLSAGDSSLDGSQIEKDSRVKSEDEDLLMSPIGDLGMSEHDAAIVDDILKDDVGKYLPRDDGKGDFDKDEIQEELGDSVSSDTELQKEDEHSEQSSRDTNMEKDDIEEAGQNEPEEKYESDEPIEEAGPSERSKEQGEEEEEKSEDEEAGEQLIADIFGASDEEEEFEGFRQEDVEVTKKKKGALEKRKKSAISDDEEEEEEEEEVAEGPGLEALVVPSPAAEESSDEDESPSKSFVSDFDEMMRKKKEINRANRKRRKDYDIVNDNDDIISAMIQKMKEAAEEDRMLNEAKQAATKKLKLLPTVLKHMNKADLQMVLLDSGVLPALKEWLAPLPDGSLPHLQIREGLLKTLAQFPAIDKGALKMSGLGKAVMYLFRHPKEIRQNRDLAGKLINEWARPIFGVTANFKSMSREEREERDYQLMPKRRRLSSAEDGGRTPKSIDNALQGEKKALRPGDKGFIMRARVPVPSTRDYVVRPKWNQERMDFSKKPVKTMNRFQKQFRKFKDRKQMIGKGDQRAVQISIEGRNMSL